MSALRVCSAKAYGVYSDQIKLWSVWSVNSRWIIKNQCLLVFPNKIFFKVCQTFTSETKDKKNRNDNGTSEIIYLNSKKVTDLIPFCGSVLQYAYISE